MIGNDENCDRDVCEGRVLVLVVLVLYYYHSCCSCRERYSQAFSNKEGGITRDTIDSLICE